MFSEFSRKLHTNRQGNLKEISSEIHFHANRQSLGLLIPKGTTFSPHFHLKWSPQKNLNKMTIWYKVKLNPLNGIHNFNLNITIHVLVSYLLHTSPSRWVPNMLQLQQDEGKEAFQRRFIAAIQMPRRSCKQAEPLCGQQYLCELQQALLFNSKAILVQILLILENSTIYCVTFNLLGNEVKEKAPSLLLVSQCIYIICNFREEQKRYL